MNEKVNEVHDLGDGEESVEDAKSLAKSRKIVGH